MLRLEHECRVVVHACCLCVRGTGRFQTFTRCCDLNRVAVLLCTRPDGPRILAVSALHCTQVVTASSSVIIRIMIISIIIICIVIIIIVFNMIVNNIISGIIGNHDDANNHKHENTNYACSPCTRC